MSGPPRVLVGTLFAGEKEYEVCREALAAQEHRAWTHRTFEHLPNREAHAAIYGLFARDREHDLHLKLDADMVFRTPGDLGRIVAVFADPGIDHLQLAVHDWFSDQRIMGIHAYRRGVRWRAGRDDLFLDPYPVHGGRRLDLWGAPGPVIDHCPDPDPYQAFHIGVHRALKALQPGRGRGDFDARASRAHYLFLRRTWEHFRRCGDRRLGLALLGAELVLTGNLDLQRVERKEEELRPIFASWVHLAGEELAQRLAGREALFAPGSWRRWRHTTGRGLGGGLVRLLAPRRAPTPPSPPPSAPAGPADPELAALVVNFECAEHTARCVAAIRAQAPAAPVVVVENGSGDDSAQRLARAWAADPGVSFLVEDLNRGFGGGCNRGFVHLLEHHPRVGRVLLVNPDTYLEEGCIAALQATASRHPEAGIVGGRVLDGTGRNVQYENGRLRPWTLSGLHVPAPPGAEDYETEFVTGALMLLDGDLLRRGLRFDEDYFLYVEDLDLCCEVRRRGSTLWVSRRAAVRHLGAAAQVEAKDPALGMGPTGLREQARSKVIFARKRLPLLQRLVFLAVAFLAKPPAGVLRTRSTRFLRPYLQGLRRGLGARLARG